MPPLLTKICPPQLRFGFVRFLLFALVCTVASAGVASPAPLRTVLNFNREWRYHLGDPAGAAAPDFSDAAWEAIGLPHSFSLPYFGATNSFYVGYGWYRKQLEVPSAWTGKRLFLHFDGVFQEAEIYINGQKVGGHRGGYTGFEIEVTDAVRIGRNLVAIRVNNHWNAQQAPRAGEHQFSGGIYRNVRLVVTNPLHVTWYGTEVTTPEVSAQSGRVRVRTEIVNQADALKECQVRTEVVNPNGEVIAQMVSTQVVLAGSSLVFDQTSPSLPHPDLWSPESPTLYSIKTTVLEGGQPVDEVATSFGFRWFEFTADRGFFLNGRHRYFRGANVHQDHAGWGDAVADTGFARDLRLMKEAGFDFIRGSHYPHAPAFSDACDRIGLLFWSENAFWGTGGADNPWGSSAYPTNPEDEADFEASVRAMLRDMIRIHRNHPSIVVWSMSNEPFFSDAAVLPKVRRFLAELVAYSHELDPSRPAAIGGAQRGGIDKLGDIAGYNGDGARLFPNPGIPNVVSEYGSMMVDRPGLFEPGWGDLPLTPGASPEEGGWRLPWRSGEIIWCGFDHGSIAGRTFGGMGMVDYFRLPKRQWYWYREAYRGVPPPAWPAPGIAAALRLEADRTVLHAIDGTEDAQITVTVIDQEGRPLSNCPPVTLRIEAGPGEFPTGDEITFAAESDIAIRDGKAAIAFRSFHGGETLIRATSPGLQDATLQILSHGEPAFIPGVTPMASPRPYRRFSDAPSTGKWHKLCLENPTRVSSEAVGSPGRHGNDGSPLTTWWAAPTDLRPWFRVDMERIATVDTVRFFLPSPGLWRLQIEISRDGERDWTAFGEPLDLDVKNAWQSHAVDAAAVTGRYLRLTLLAWPEGTTAGIGDVSATGVFTSD